MVYHYAPTVAPARGACAMRHARRAALAHGELLGLECVVRPPVGGLTARMSHPDYHCATIANAGQKEKPRPMHCMGRGWCLVCGRSGDDRLP